MELVHEAWSRRQLVDSVVAVFVIRNNIDFWKSRVQRAVEPVVTMRGLSMSDDEHEFVLLTWPVALPLLLLLAMIRSFVVLVC